MEIRTSPKNPRGPQRRTLALRDAILAVAAEYDRMSVRQLFYQLVARGHIDKTENQYKRVAAKLSRAAQLFDALRGTRHVRALGLQLLAGEFEREPYPVRIELIHL